MQNTTLPRIVPRNFEDEGRMCRNIGSVGYQEVGGGIGGQETTHSRDLLRNGGIAGEHGGEIAGRHGGEIGKIKRQRVLDFFGSSMDKEFWTVLSEDFWTREITHLR